MSLGTAITDIVNKVTRKWTTVRKREERQARARLRRSEYMYSTRVNQTDVAWDVIPRAYDKASGGGKLPVKARQIFYAARGEIQDHTGRPLNSQYFTQTLLPRYINTHPEAQSWPVLYDARGHLIEPHTGKVVPLGTLEVDKYLHDVDRHHVAEACAGKAFGISYPTMGPKNRISAVLFIEKEGFHELFEAVKLADRYDIAIMSTKGQSNVSARKLVDTLCCVGADVPLLIAHDFDKSGLEISQTLTSVSWAAEEAGRVRYEFVNEIDFIDIGLRLEDVEQWNLASESVRFKGDFGLDTIATPEEQDFLRSNRRVELNAFTSPDFIKWIESKLEEHGIKKVIPDDDTLEKAYRRAYQIAAINRDLDRMAEKAAARAQAAELPKSLRDTIQERFNEHSELPWDDVVTEIAERNVEAEGE